MNRSTQEIDALSGDSRASEAAPGIVSDLVALTKARLSLLVIVTTFVGFCMASHGRFDWLLLVNAVAGTTLAACAAAVLNQFLEANADRLMERTRHRPLPAGRMRPATRCSWASLSAWQASRGCAHGECLERRPRARDHPDLHRGIYTPLKRKTPVLHYYGRGLRAPFLP